LGRVQPAVKPKAPAKKVLKDDREIEDVVMSLLVKRGQAIARTILENYDIMRGEHPTKIARLLAVMRSVAEKNPGLVVEGTSKDTKLREGTGGTTTASTGNTAGNHHNPGIEPTQS
jgi:hypothetical protein